MKRTFFFLILLSAFSFNSCDILDQAQQAVMLSKCEFRLSTLTNAKLAGVNVQQIKSYKDLSVPDAAKIASAYAKVAFRLVLHLMWNRKILMHTLPG